MQQAIFFSGPPRGVGVRRARCVVRIVRSGLRRCRYVRRRIRRLGSAAVVGAGGVRGVRRATVAAANKVADLTAAGKLLSVAGGGDTVAALNQAGAAERFSYVSTAGGAFLEWMEGKTLPGVAALG